ncbi:formylglycine-generating enzyme family protein [Methylomonas koyamae]|uniref:formylglycine-generating enzyme family protein n=1 Tax=Methylomonas koyamae TaxID=702114 RepID=UPI000BC341A9|nr:formylglycine-generating enzyme family protein [Methylomonas koyamae]ATG89081.1 Serine/threonine-protein kinase pkn1 [Methylomonas koyamae]
MNLRQGWLLLFSVLLINTGHGETLPGKAGQAASSKSKPAPVRKARNRAAKHFRDCADCPEMVAIPGGVYLMGSPVTDQEGQDYEKPRHDVKVSGFAIGKYEISKAQFAAFVEAANYNPGNECWTMEAGKGEMRSNRNWSAPGYPQDSDHPATCVSVDDAEAYIKWLNQKTGKHYRLPTEAEWEYAARGGSAAARFWGDNPDGACKYANVADLSLQKADSKAIPHNCEDGYVFTAPVGSYSPNAFGLYDMLGNVWEWTCSADSGYGSSEEEKCTGLLSRRIYRGGSWINTADYVRSASRYGYIPSFRFNNVGFRLARDN